MVEIDPSSLVILPEEEVAVLNVPELVIQPADWKFGIGDGCC